MDIVKENFQVLDLDPGFRIADEAEIKMLEKDVLETILEEHYQTPDNAFLHYVSCYTDKNDNQIGNLILQLYYAAQSHRDPEKWLQDTLAPYRNAASSDFDSSHAGNEWIRFCEDIICSKIDSACRLCRKGLALCDQEGGPEKYRADYENVLVKLEQMQTASLREMGTFLNVLLDGWNNLPRVNKSEG